MFPLDLWSESSWEYTEKELEKTYDKTVVEEYIDNSQIEEWYLNEQEKIKEIKNKPIKLSSGIYSIEVSENGINYYVKKKEELGKFIPDCVINSSFYSRSPYSYCYTYDKYGCITAYNLSQCTPSIYNNNFDNNYKIITQSKNINSKNKWKEVQVSIEEFQTA